MDCFTLFSVISALGFSVFPLQKIISFFNLCSFCCIIVLWFVQNCFLILIQVFFLGCNSLVFGCFRLFSFFLGCLSHVDLLRPWLFWIVFSC